MKASILYRSDAANRTAALELLEQSTAQIDQLVCILSYY